MYILGVNALFHESSACLLRDGVLVAFAEEERFSRIKHAKATDPQFADELPMLAIEYCFDLEGIGWSDLATVAYSANPANVPADVPPAFVELVAEYCTTLDRILPALRALGFLGEIAWVDHHTARAASAYFGSGFPDSAVLALDGIGEVAAGAAYIGRGNRLERLRTFDYPRSIGYLWELVSTFLGFEVYDAAKVMGLAAYGDAGRLLPAFEKVTTLGPAGSLEFDDDVLQLWQLDYDHHTGYWDGLVALLGVAPRSADAPLLAIHYDIAAALQSRTDAMVAHVVADLHDRTGSSRLCLAGGVALNCVTNRRVFEDGPFDELFVQPAAHDAGTALGAALFIWSHVLDRASVFTMDHAYWGPEFADAEIDSAL